MHASTRMALLFALALSDATALAEEAPAQDSADRLEEMVVVGSRARSEARADQLPVPVDVHQGFDLARTGELDLGAALTKLAPSFNYSRLSVGDGALFHTATLRGLGPDQTLVLVNGKRRHSMAWIRVLDGVIGYGTGGTDLRAIPSAAVGRVGSAARRGSGPIWLRCHRRGHQLGAQGLPWHRDHRLMPAPAPMPKAARLACPSTVACGAWATAAS